MRLAGRTGEIHLFSAVSHSITLRTSFPSRSKSLRAILRPESRDSGEKLPSRSFRHGVDEQGRPFVLLGLGGNPRTVQLRVAATRALRAARELGTGDLEFDCSHLEGLDIAAAGIGQALAEGVSIAAFEAKSFAGTASKKPSSLAVRVAIAAPYQAGFRKGLLVGRGINTSRELANTPPNIATPEWMTLRARKLAETHGMGFRVIAADEAKKLGMGGLLAVGAGSAYPPRLVILDWNPSGRKTVVPVLLVGKTITYDSGGLSIKPDGGKGMKADKSGGCTMLGTMEALALLKAKTRVVCILAIAENMIDAKSYRLDDVITHFNGVTCEITNTDAEGRLVLADALAWGTKAYSPSAVIDAATLTGGVLVALGTTIAGAFSNDDDLMRRLDEAANESDERVWRLPLENDLRDKMRASMADLHNSAPSRYAQPGTAAAYLSFFVGENAPKAMPTIPWIHLDMAGTATSEGESDWDGLFPKGPTGWGVRLLTRLLATF